MPEPPPPPVAAGAADGPPGPLTPAAVEALLADFRAWLGQASDVPLPDLPPVAVDWETLLGGWAALRHEVNLQTKASRAQLEQNAQALQALREAAASPGPAAPPDDAIRPLLKALVDVHDALTLARREVQRLNDQPPAPVAPPAALPWWARRLGVGRLVERVVADATAGPRQELDALRQKVDALLVGYDMGVQRVERALQQHGLEPIPTVGRPFDPERMEAVDVVRDPGRAAAAVLEEVRRGYLWQGRVFRFAQVRVARP